MENGCSGATILTKERNLGEKAYISPELCRISMMNVQYLAISSPSFTLILALSITFKPPLSLTYGSSSKFNLLDLFFF